MIDLMQFQKDIKNKKFNNCYILCGYDEKLIRESVSHMVDMIISPEFKDLNYSQFDGETINSAEIINSCETLPFMSEKKVVLVYRAAFLGDSDDKNLKRNYEEISKYILNMPSSSVLILYYVMGDKREKVPKSIIKLEKAVCVVKADKLRGESLTSKIKELLSERGKEIGKSELKLISTVIENDLGIIENEVDKLYWYTYGRDIRKEDIIQLFSKKSDDDIFDMVDFLSQKKAVNALEVLNDLIYRDEKIPYILFMVERQFKLLLQIKTGLEDRMSKNDLISTLKLNPYICEKMITQSKKFTIKQLERTIASCLDVEERLKSTSVDAKIEMEMMMLRSIEA